MKLTKIKTLCVAAGRAELIVEMTQEGELRRQWISNGEALWLLTGLPCLEPENLPILLGLTNKQAEKLSFGLQPFPAEYDSSDYAASDRVIRRAACSISALGQDLLLLNGSQGTLLIQSAHIAPVWTETTMIIERRTKGGRTYIVLLDGLLVTGIVMPVPAQSLISETDKAALRLLVQQL